MTVVQLAGGEILLHSPCRPSPELIDDIAKVGHVTDVVAPNWFHDLYLSQYHSLYPEATFWGPSLLQRQGKVSRLLDAPARPPWFSEMPHFTLRGLLTFDESLFFHVPTRTLIVADQLMNARVEAGTPLFTRLGYRLFGLNGTLKVCPVLRWFGISSRGSVRDAADQIFEWNPQRVIVGHGAPIDRDADIELRDAFAWLGR
jgi:hypothetical protein